MEQVLSPVPQASNIRRFAVVGYRVLAWLFVAGVIVQVFLAGQAVFISPTFWLSHKDFIHIIEGLPLFMLLVAWLGRLPRALRWTPLALLGLIFVQYATAGMGTAPATRWVGALHPVGGLLIFSLALSAAHRALRA